MSNQSFTVETVEKYWLKQVECHRKFAEFGFVESYPVDPRGRLKEAEFSSKHFIFVIGIDLLLNEPYGQTLDADTRMTVPELGLALCYFLPEIDTLIARYEGNRYEGKDNIEQYFDVTVALYRENPWVIHSKAWTLDQEFLDAIKKTQQWVYNEMRGGMRPLKRWEFKRRLHSYRKPETQIPSEVR
ncbi:hypothetical protein FUT69_11465 [Xylella taiwanensis]|uniref:Uncharacterized protein n=1 Tax=Xylella taiwanensis TaxID=1444770 RepID=Z9JFU9_9GAMM|nr:hypothetical protein [Xylella taiwanensis]AXI84391.1 hypothetical protein AB672_10845 [Xylella taiwanensis]EWS76913.1 hypothetical protein AF72_13665 [Xylella taiwanensis]NBI37728.1 hypothetical protein [Xylella taiwanensis]QKD99268.1 hypothetical protein PLS229_10865 [Xylella taiwanensis]UFM94547.1 hypothetical protein LPH39_04660 [Xylella taiwanensis]